MAQVRSSWGETPSGWLKAGIGSAGEVSGLFSSGSGAFLSGMDVPFDFYFYRNGIYYLFACAFYFNLRMRIRKVAGEIKNCPWLRAVPNA
jgi:hypothetical protein